MHNSKYVEPVHKILYRGYLLKPCCQCFKDRSHWKREALNDSDGFVKEPHLHQQRGHLLSTHKWTWREGGREREREIER